MQKSLVGIALAALALVPAAAGAQGMREPKLSVVASAGSNLYANYLGTGAEQTPGFNYGLGLQLRTGVRGLDVRGTFQYANPRLRLGGAPADNVTLQRYSLDAVVRLPRLLGTQPYVLAGVGVKYYDFDTEEPGRSDQANGVLRLGGGLEWKVGRVGAFVEGVQSSSYFDQAGSSRPDYRPQIEHSVTAGIRIPLRW